MNNTSSKNLFQVSHIGVGTDITPVMAKRIILTNILGFVFAIYMSISAVAFIFFGYYKLSTFSFFFVATELSWPLLNHFKKYNLARLGLMISSNILGFLVSISLPATGYNRGFFVMAGLPILLFGLQEKKSIILGLLLPLILYPISEWFQYVNPLALELTLSTATFVRYTSGTIYVLLIFLMFLFLSRENARSERILEEERARTFSSSKFAALGEMASGIGHEINNPMTVIELNTDHLKYLLSSPEFTKEAAIERVAVISKTVKRVAKIIKSMRNFSREGQDDPFLTENIAKIIDDTLVFCAERFKNHEIKLEVSRPEDVTLNCRSVQISQVLLNLLNNSFDAIENLPEKWIKLEVKANPSTLLISITDSGRGILESNREKIFQPFFTTKPVGKGTGLGLSLSRQIILNHGGSLTLDTKSPHTRFVIQLARSLS